MPTLFLNLPCMLRRYIVEDGRALAQVLDSVSARQATATSGVIYGSVRSCKFHPVSEIFLRLDQQI